MDSPTKRITDDTCIRFKNNSSNQFLQLSQVVQSLIYHWLQKAPVHKSPQTSIPFRIDQTDYVRIVFHKQISTPGEFVGDEWGDTRIAEILEIQESANR